MFTFQKPSVLNRNRRWILYALMIVGVVLITFSCNTSDSGSKEEGSLFESGRIASGETFSYTFEETGTVNYHCNIHEPDMKGKITVKKGAADSGQVTIEMENSQFVPQQKTIAPQTKVKWVNRDSYEHTVVSGKPHESDGDDGGGYGGGY